MLHHEDGAPRGQLSNERDDPAHVFAAHPLGRLVEEHQLGLERQGRRELERPLAPVRELDGAGPGVTGEVDRVEQLHSPLVENLEAALRAPEVE